MSGEGAQDGEGGSRLRPAVGETIIAIGVLALAAVVSFAEEPAKKDGEKKYSDETQRVFDVDKGEWRSFRWDSVQAVVLS